MYVQYWHRWTDTFYMQLALRVYLNMELPYGTQSTVTPLQFLTLACSARFLPFLLLGLILRLRSESCACHVIFGLPKYSFPLERIFQTLPEILGPPLKYLFPHIRLLGLNVAANKPANSKLPHTSTATPLTRSQAVTRHTNRPTNTKITQDQPGALRAPGC